MQYERMLDKEHKPSQKEILGYLGDRAGEAWMDIVSFLGSHYDFLPDVDYGGSQYGWFGLSRHW